MSDLESFTNDSGSRDYAGPNEHGDYTELRNRHECQNCVCFHKTLSFIEKQQDKLETKSEEICNLKISNAAFESMIDTKDDIIQQQATKIHDLREEIQLLKQKNFALENQRDKINDNTIRREPFRRRLFQIRRTSSNKSLLRIL